MSSGIEAARACGVPQSATRATRVTTVQVAECWFSRRSIGDGITLLWEPHVHPLLRCNIWHVRGRDGDMLVDTGMGLASLEAATADPAQSNLLAVATHARMDHMGSMHEFTQRATHVLEAGSIASGDQRLPLAPAAYDDATLAFLTDVGYDIREGLLHAWPHAHFDPGAHVLRPAEATRLLHEGDVVDLGDRAFAVLHLPGHSPGSIGLWDARSRTLFSGDAISYGPLLDAIPGANVEHYMQTMHRLRTLPVEVVHGGHDASFGRARLIEIVDAFLALRG